MFIGFLWPYQITYQAVTPGYTDQATGNWIPETVAERSITGAIMTLKEEELKRLEPGIFKLGDRKLLALRSEGILPGNRVKVNEDGTSATTEWTIISKQESPRATFKSMALDFETFFLSRRV